MKIKTLVLTLFAAFLFLFLCGCTSNNTSNNNINNGSDDSNWLDNYTPAHGIGTDSNDFWIDFPSGQSVQHKTWITESLEEKPVFFVCHRTGCIGCAAQAERVIAFGEKYSEDTVFYDLDDDYAGTAPADILEKYNEAFDYDPNGGNHYIALTGIFTLVNDGGEVKIGWHSWEAPDDMTVSDSDLETWIKDSIYYYKINNQG